ncbi:Valine--tRNA ligase [Lentibacillus sp. JNUCC-1]|nr:Valine--tRNA ligase [Lentibacillus sp. JNUCC-1]
MRMLHPFMPFVTEEIWQKLPHEGPSITVAEWPQIRPDLHDEQASEEMKRLVSIIKSVRNIRAEVDTPMSKQIKLLIKTENQAIAEELKGERNYLERFCNPDELVIDTTVDVPEKAMSAVVTGAELFLPLEGLIDFDKEINRLNKELEKWTKEVERVQKKLANANFVNKAPEAVVNEEKQKEKDYLEKQSKVKARIQELQN